VRWKLPTRCLRRVDFRLRRRAQLAAHSAIIRSAHSTMPTKIVGLPNLNPPLLQVGFGDESARVRSDACTETVQGRRCEPACALGIVKLLGLPNRIGPD
jgi:hypothetical protein